MNQAQRFSVVTQLADEMRNAGSWCGETNLQKSVYFVQELFEVKTGYSFNRTSCTGPLTPRSESRDLRRPLNRCDQRPIWRTFQSGAERRGVQRGLEIFCAPQADGPTLSTSIAMPLSTQHYRRQRPRWLRGLSLEIPATSSSASAMITIVNASGLISTKFVVA